MQRRLIFIAATALLAGAVGGLGYVAVERLAGSPTASYGQALVGGPFSLTNHHGQRVSEKDFKGQHLLVFFGFTNCPDVCPTGLQNMASALALLGDRAARITPVFVSVDPERDTPQSLAAYVGAFHPRLVGLTGTKEEVQAAAKAYRVYFQRVADPTSTAGYTMDHSSIVYHMGPDGSYIGHFTHATTPETMSERLTKVLGRS